MQSDILLKEKYDFLLPLLSEKDKRIVLASDAKSMGRGGLGKVSKLSGLSSITLNFGVAELNNKTGNATSILRCINFGGRRKKK